MKIVNTGRQYIIYDDSLKTYDKLPAQPYRLCFSKMGGFYYEAQKDFDIKEEKIYGVHNAKVDKVMSGFKSVERNFGVILSGAKGIGKSLFAKLLCNKAVEEGYPVIIVDTAYPNIPAVLEDLDQECVVLFDEFEKTFTDKDGENSVSQDSLLSMFDGITNSKKLFVVTCNNIHQISDYLINRPGRFHYHFRFDYPSAEEVEEYLQDKLNSNYWSEISKVQGFAAKVNINYDCLRAIAFELNTGLSFEDAIQDLNIININKELYTLTLVFDNGMRCVREYRMDVFNPENVRISFEDDKGRNIFNTRFSTGNFKYDAATRHNVLAGNDIALTIDDYYDDCDDYEYYQKLRPVQIIAERSTPVNYHYAV